jgi:hypothetical protein
MRCWGIRPLAWALWLAVLPGCLVGRVYRDHPLDEQKIMTIQRDVTTKAQILLEFGPPQEIDTRELVAIGVPFEQFLSRRGSKPPVESVVGVRYFRYTISRGNAFALILLLFNYGDFDQKNDTLVIFFDSNDVVEDYAYERDTDKLPRFGFWSRWFSR